MSKSLFDPREYPDHHDAELVLKLYELRREPAMRESRNAIAANFLPRTFDELMAVTRRDHPLNAAFRQTSTYWEMTYSMARYGIVHPDFLLESTGEGMLLYAKVAPYLEQYRAATTPRAFGNAEWVATHSALGREVFARMRDRVRQLVAAT